MDHTLLVLCLDIPTTSLLWGLRARQVVAIGITLLKGDQPWLLKDTVRCLAMVVVFRAVLVDTAAATRCKVAMVALQVLVAILPMAKPATTVATRVDPLQYSDATRRDTTRQYKPITPCDMLPFFQVPSRTLYAVTTLLTTMGVSESTSSGLEYTQVQLSWLACAFIATLIVHIVLTSSRSEASMGSRRKAFISAGGNFTIPRLG